MSVRRFGVRVWVVLSLVLGPVAHSAAHASQSAPSATPQQVQTYEAFRVWINAQPKPGRALDVGMGQGRNTIYLARQGWDAVGFDPADRAIAAAQDEARKLGGKITTHVARAEDFAWGEGQWDLIVVSYVGGREYVGQVLRALRPGGMLDRTVELVRPAGPPPRRNEWAAMGRSTLRRGVVLRSRPVAHDHCSC